MDLSIERRVHSAGPDGGVDLVARGRIDAETAAEIEAAVEEELRRGVHTLRLDLDGVAFLSSAGIRSLFNVNRAAKAAGGSCLISRASAPIEKVLTLARLAPILMEHHGGTKVVAEPSSPGTIPASPTAPPSPGGRRSEERIGDVVLVDLDLTAMKPVAGVLVGAACLPGARGAIDETPRNVPRDTFGIGIGSFADEGPAVTCGGELVAACGSVFIRPPRPFGVPDSLVSSGDLVPTVRLATGLFWEGIPRGRAGFEAAGDGASVPLDDLLGSLLHATGAESLAVAIVGEVKGLVGAELIRPLAEAEPEDTPATGTAAVAARWLSFSREPCHAGRTALVVGVATRQAGSMAGDFLRPLGSVQGHFHATIFPHRPLRRGVADAVSIIDDLAGSAPLAVLHLLADPFPVLGSGRPELVRGGCWFAPLVVRGAGGLLGGGA